MKIVKINDNIKINIEMIYSLERHDNKNDGITRCVINYMYRPESNKTEEFDIIKNFHILNLYEDKIPEELKQWLQAIYQEL